MNITKLKKLRESRKLQQKQIAIELGITHQCYSLWENGKRQPDHQALKQLAAYFGVTIDYLLDAKPPDDNIIDISGLSDESKKYLQSQVKIAERLDRAEENNAVNSALGLNPKIV